MQTLLLIIRFILLGLQSHTSICTSSPNFLTAVLPLINHSLAQMLLMITFGQTPLNSTGLLGTQLLFRWSRVVLGLSAAFACVDEDHYYERCAVWWMRVVRRRWRILIEKAHSKASLKRTTNEILPKHLLLFPLSLLQKWSSSPPRSFVVGEVSGGQLIPF